MNQITYEQFGAGVSQADRILDALLRASTDLAVADGWVTLPQLVAISGGYAVHSRVADLRKRGYDIEQTSVRRAGKVHSFYRLRREIA
jgi:hypothetical protein